ncbi:AAA family ATPase [Prevotella bivia]|uniref:Protein CR006 P-loop domain-containing protein n=1 Tax=Prevotella bivia DSM 20514 TaxID=868129 RepID=I4Z9G3_9BACT|nr:AAA family ATPase [Prevotella bivia]EFB92602.1 hypothetical protein HMPREF0648_0534 [Prevotella bivia JCVIHMP010]EIM32855.1 hypothetical protein PrebiDRAFT_1130 [Prevotella bivia DSM 20514]
MFENFKKINIKGGYFDEETELRLFNEDSLSILYGRNGSGKSTIARCLKQLCETEEERIKREENIAQGKETNYTVSSDVSITDEYKPNVFVFDEDFLQNNIKVKDDGLNAIIMLGEQVELDEQINANNEKLSKKVEELNQQEELLRKYENKEDNVSPLYYWEQIRNGLREEGGWADIDRELKGNSVKSRVTEDLIDKLIKIDEPKESYSELREQVMADKNLYLQSENSQPIIWDVGELKLPNNLDDLTVLLKKPLDSPELTEREHRLMELLKKISQEQQHFELNHTQHILEEGWSFCPLCLREITTEDRASISEVLSHILMEEAKEFTSRIISEQSLFAAIEMDFPKFPGDLNTKELHNAITAKEKLNKMLSIIWKIIEQRRRDIYKPLEKPFTEEIINDYIKARVIWETAIEQIRKCVEIFNGTVNKRNKLLVKVRHENNLMAKKRFSLTLNQYQKALTNKNQILKKSQELKEEKDKIDADVKELKMKRERTDIALEYINKELQYVFYSNRKIQLVAGEGCYKLMANGKKVKPKKISVGERNVLGLCYFFAMLFSGKKDEDKYASEYLIVIDDPISSFDYGNRLGVMSLLRYQFCNITKGNANSRLLVMSHDLQSVFDLVKIRRDLNDERGKMAFLELKNKCIEDQKGRNEYKKLITHVFEYANNMHPEDLDEIQEMSIGNFIRRMLEAFSSFCYNKSFESMLRMDGILNNIPEDKRVYYENFMCRLALNGESHEEEHTYTLNNFESLFTKEEKQQTAKSVLRFLLYVNKPHIEAYLNEKCVTKILGWKTEEDNWISSGLETMVGL